MSTATNLPAELTSFVGRGPQLAELRRQLHRSRLITLTGPGGAGKTRLALRLARESLHRFPDGVWLVDLAAVGDEQLLEHTVASACGIKEDSKRPILEAIANGVGASRVLIVLDGCEHLVESCAAMTSRLLRSCPKLTALVTSREPLGVTGEVIWRTPSLTLPRSEDRGHPELLLESEAIRLFLDRARLSRPDFELDSTSAAPVAQICIRLEGIPLAIELAAGLNGVMTVREILEGLHDRFRLLTGGSRTTLPRHQTLRQAVDWSYGLLTAMEQAMFARLSVFAGGFDLAAVEAVAGHDPVKGDQVLAILSRLVHKSLVGAEPGRAPTTRYRMLDTIREFALEKVPEGDHAELRRRHAVYFGGWSTRATAELESAEQFSWLQRLDEEQANVRLAIEWWLSERPDEALRLVGTMESYWWMRRHLGEGLQWLGRALEVPTSNEALRAPALAARARLRRRRGEYEAAGRDAAECAEISRRLGLSNYLGRALTMLGIVASEMGDMASASRYFNEVLELAKRLGPPRRIATSLNNLAVTDLLLGNLTSAQTRAEEALQIAETLADRFVKANILDTVARVLLRLGEHDEAARRYAEGLTIAAEFEDTMTSADCMDGLALLATLHGDPTRTIVLIAAAQGLRSSSGGERTAVWSVDVEAGLAKARAKVGRVAADAAWERGAAFSMQEAVSFARGVHAEPVHGSQSRLTDREVQVARLIASGLTNGEVAARLRISNRTVDAHVEHIRNKLGLRTRAQMAVWAHERLGTA